MYTQQITRIRKYHIDADMWILIVEDEAHMARALKQGLEERNHTVTLANDGCEALDLVRMSGFDLMILDVMLPAVDGLAVARRLRQEGSSLPILMLTARDTPEDIVKGLDAGADDYLVKPFALNVLLARIRALSRRSAHPALPVLQVDDLKLDPSSHQVERGGGRIELTATEYRFLEYLMRRVGRAASRSSIIEAVWGFEQDVEPNTVDVYIKSLRDKLDNDPSHRLIHTVRGYGYILRDRP